MKGLRRRAVAAVEESYLIDVGFACAGVFIKDGIVVEAPPIFRWMLGKEWERVKKWNKIVDIS